MEIIQKNIVAIECYRCGIIFWVSTRLNENWKENKRSFYCPNGHSQEYIKSTADILRGQLQTTKIELNNKDGEIRLLERKIKGLSKNGKSKKRA